MPGSRTRRSHLIRTSRPLPGLPGGGTLRETLSRGRVYAEARQAADSGLLHEVVSSAPQLDPKRGQQLLGEEGNRRLRQALELVEAKATPDETSDYRDFILRVAETAARAHKEGGFLDIGGTEVSEREQVGAQRARPDAA